MNTARHLAWLRAEVTRTRDRVEDFERSLRGRELADPVERDAASLALRIRWNAKAHARRRLDEFVAWLDARIELP